GPAAGPGAAPGQPAPGLSGPDTLAPLAAPDSSDIRVARSHVPPQADPALEAGYLAFNSGDLARAQQQYALALRTDPNNRDALLGTAAVALRQRQEQQAAAIYSRLLDLDPNDGDALAGLMGLRQGDAAQAELRLKTVLTRTPDAAPVQFALGNLYARQGRWSEAQQAYFRAWSAAPGNADYAYNLAIGLDRLNQGKLALTYYQKALALAQDAPASFDRAALRQRLHQLSQLNQQVHPVQP
ncbi:tetratricopeptide repeat protein, partial [Duganella sp. LX20W]